MPELSLSRKLLFGGAVALGLAAGAVGIAAAQSTEEPPATAAEDGDRDPSYTSSVTAPEGPEDLSEMDEAAALASLATVTEAKAREIALGVVPGEVSEIELDNENGSVVWSVDVTRDGGDHEVVVDAGNGKVLAQDADDDGGEADMDESEDDDAEHDADDDDGAESADD